MDHGGYRRRPDDLAEHFAVALLSKKAFAIFKDYEKQKKQGLDPVFHPEQFGIDDSEGIWKVNQESEEK